jgi:hypothetical protein
MPLVSDTTALRYLIEIEAVYLLPVLFGQVTIPQPAYQGSLFLRYNRIPGMRHTASSAKGSGR